MPPEDNGGENQDPLFNKTKELERKVGNTETQLATLAQQNAALLAQLNKMTAPAPKAEEKLKDLWYTDEDRAASMIVDKAVSTIENRLSQQQGAQQKQQQVLNQLVSDYPELADNTDPLYVRAIEVYNGLSAEERANPMAYKLSVKDAASELGVRPRSKRSAGDDSFSLGNNGASPASRNSRSEQLDPKMLQFAQAVGLDLTNKKTVDSLKANAQRKDWNRYR